MHDKGRGLSLFGCDSHTICVYFRRVNVKVEGTVSKCKHAYALPLMSPNVLTVAQAFGYLTCGGNGMIDYEMLCIFGLIVCNGMQLATIWTLQKRLGYHVEY